MKIINMNHEGMYTVEELREHYTATNSTVIDETVMVSNFNLEEYTDNGVEGLKELLTYGFEDDEELVDSIIGNIVGDVSLFNVSVKDINIIDSTSFTVRITGSFESILLTTEDEVKLFKADDIVLVDGFVNYGGTKKVNSQGTVVSEYPDGIYYLVNIDNVDGDGFVNAIVSKKYLTSK